MAGAPTAALGRRPTRNSISRKSSTRSRQDSQRRRWSRAHSRSLPSSRSSSTALGEMRVQRLRSKLDVVINLPELRAATVERVHQLARGDVDDLGELVIRELDEITEQYHGPRFEWQGAQRSLHGVTAERAPRVRLGKPLEADLQGAVAAKPAAGTKRLTAELGRDAKDVRAAYSLARGTMAQAVGNLAKRGAGDRRGAVNIIHQPRDVIENEREVRIELAFHGYGPSAECRCFDVYLIHYLDVGRMPAV